MTKARKVLTVEEVAERLRCSAATVRRHAEDWGGFKPKGARRWLFREDELVA